MKYEREKMSYFPSEKGLLVSGCKRGPEVQGQRCSFSQQFGEADMQATY